MQQIGNIVSPSNDLHFAESASRTHHILEPLRDVGLAGRKVDFLYDSMRTLLVIRCDIVEAPALAVDIPFVSHLAFSFLS